MNYRHSYHAGNFADVFKHVLVISLIQSLLGKNKPFCYFDTHAGIGDYDLDAASAQKTQEFNDGISKLWPLGKSVTLPIAVADYLQIIKTWNDQKHSTNQLRYYPGSPMLVRKLLRPDDRMILTELHPQDVAQLKQQFAHDKQTAIHHVNGYQGLKAFLPPKQSRGLALIDPPFEKPDEFMQIVNALQLAIKRWNTGIYTVWYPIKNTLGVNHFYQSLQATGIRKILRCEISLPNAIDKNLNACGMIIIHPPWQWHQEIESVLAWLSDTLAAPDKGRYHVEWLAPE